MGVETAVCAVPASGGGAFLLGPPPMCIPRSKIALAVEQMMAL
jgi:hypothetical protein